MHIYVARPQCAIHETTTHISIGKFQSGNKKSIKYLVYHERCKYFPHTYDMTDRWVPFSALSRAISWETIHLSQQYQMYNLQEKTSHPTKDDSIWVPYLKMKDFVNQYAMSSVGCYVIQWRDRNIYYSLRRSSRYYQIGIAGAIERW